MSIKTTKNKYALVRHLAIDRRLRHLPHPTLDELIDYVNEKMDDGPVSKRTVQLDIQDMRYSTGIRAFAPIVVKRGKRFTYCYADEDYSFIGAIVKNWE